MPDWLTKTSKRKVPVGSILLAFVLGMLAFLPFPSWQSLVGLVTSATAIMYAFAPIALAALRERDPERAAPTGCRAEGAQPHGLHLRQPDHLLGRLRGDLEDPRRDLRRPGDLRDRARRRDDVHRKDVDWRAASWIWPWLIGMTIIGLLGRYGTGAAASCRTGGTSVPS